MGEIINFYDTRPFDPILKKGDLIRLVRMKEFAEIEYDIETYEFYSSLEGVCGIVTGIDMILPQDHDDAPGQAMFVTVSVPYEECWETIASISICHIRRIIGSDSKEFNEYHRE
tara:strand:- start:896 stop:1237 length:342 start_codon:yes stop_codon:yes gene_type:complete